MDTDSFTIYTYVDIAKDIETRFDTSKNYDLWRPCSSGKNKKVNWLMKMEFAALRPKT